MTGSNKNRRFFSGGFFIPSDGDAYKFQ